MGSAMDLLKGFALLLLCQSAGEALVRLTGAPWPGPVLGMGVLLVVLQVPRLRAPVGLVADGLLAHLSLLFVPVGVGVITHLALLSQYGGRMLLAIVLSTAAGLAVTAWVLRALLARARAPAAS
jgi:holin-like protein